MRAAYGGAGRPLCRWVSMGAGVGAGWQGVPMIDHLSLQTDHLAAAVGWYDAVLAPLGISRVLDFEGVAGYGPTGGPPSFWLGAATDPGGRQTHIAFAAA